MTGHAQVAFRPGAVGREWRRRGCHQAGDTKLDWAMRRVFTAWSETDGGEITCFGLGEDRPKTGNGEPLWNCVFPVWRVEAGSWEEAMTIYNFRLGYTPYKPVGEAAPCPNCGSLHYPEGSGQCWNCDYEG